MITKEEAREIAVEAIERFAAARPRPLHVTLGAAAEMLEVSRPTLKKTMERLGIKRNAFGMVLMSDVDRMLATDGLKNGKN